MIKKNTKNGVILFDNSTIQNLYLSPEIFGKSNNQEFTFKFTDKDGSEYLDGLKLRYMKDTHIKYFVVRGTFKNIGFGLLSYQKE